jgi:hypothetical protein
MRPVSRLIREISKACVTVLLVVRDLPRLDSIGC